MSALHVFGDRLAARLMAQTTELQENYEQRLSALRVEVARLESENAELASRPALPVLPDGEATDPGAVDAMTAARIAEIAQRQSRIEARQDTLLRLNANLSPGGASPSGAGAAPVPAPRPRVPPTIERRSSAPRRQTDTAGDLGRSRSLELEQPGQMLRNVERRLRRVEDNETRVVGGILATSERRLNLFTESLDEVDFDHAALLAPPATGRRGPTAAGRAPQVPVSLADQRSPLGASLMRINGNVDRLRRLQGVMDALPFARPMGLDVRISSGFGFRNHPILGIARLHAGMDFAAPTGTPVRSGGSGVVNIAGWAGGYGNLVQIDHGRGFVSRFAHLSEIRVSVGQPVSRGTVIGLVGSTGMSTGPHLHYETRLEGEALDPMRFIRGGDRFLPVPLTSR